MRKRTYTIPATKRAARPASQRIKGKLSLRFA